jgi:AraC-like DNA-binding protein
MFIHDMRPIEFKQHDIAVMLPDHIIGHGECSEDYSTTMIVIDREFFDQLTNRESFSGYLKYKNRPNYHLNEEQYSQINTLLATLRLVIEIDHPKRIESLANLLDILFYALTDYRGEESLDKNENRNTFLFNSFYDLLIENYQQHHEIAWYSEKLCLTPKYFSGVIRQITGKSAAQWINEVLVLHAKRLLYTRRDMNVQQIAYELGFKGNANFCRFFKDQTGLRPSEYRKQQ